MTFPTVYPIADDRVGAQIRTFVETGRSTIKALLGDKHQHRIRHTKTSFPA